MIILSRVQSIKNNDLVEFFDTDVANHGTCTRQSIITPCGHATFITRRYPLNMIKHNKSDLNNYV